MAGGISLSRGTYILGASHTAHFLIAEENGGFFFRSSFKSGEEVSWRKGTNTGRVDCVCGWGSSGVKEVFRFVW